MAANNDTPSGWLDDLYFQVGERTSQAAGAAASGEGFSLSRDDAEQLVKKLSKIVDELDLLRSRAETLKRVTPPAADSVSRKFNQALVGSNSTCGVFIDGARHVEREAAYLLELKYRLEKALGRTVATDGNNRGNFRPI